MKNLSSEKSIERSEGEAEGQEASGGGPLRKSVPDFETATGTRNPAAQAKLVGQVMNVLRLPKGSNEKIEEMSALIGMLQEMKPRDVFEGMLATQMVATHETAMECLQRAQSSEFLEARDVLLRHAERLFSLYAKQLEALDKRRGKGQKQIIVKHVNVEPGGQAVVGNVQTATHGRGRQLRETAPLALPEQSGTAMETVAKHPTKVRRGG